MKLWVMFFTDDREGGHGLPYSSSSKNSSHGEGGINVRVGRQKRKRSNKL